MSNATSTAILLAIPVFLVTVAPFGFLKNRLVYIVATMVMMVIGSALLLAAGFASQMAVGTGSGGSGGWEGWWPFPLWLLIGFSLLAVGVLIRSNGLKKWFQPSDDATRSSEWEAKVPALDEAARNARRVSEDVSPY